MKIFKIGVRSGFSTYICLTINISAQCSHLKIPNYMGVYTQQSGVSVWEYQYGGATSTGPETQPKEAHQQYSPEKMEKKKKASRNKQNLLLTRVNSYPALLYL